MRRSGVANLKLHPGRAPHWLVKRMMPMASAICEFVVMEYGTTELLKRLADPVWFQALSNVLGYDWDSSGSTTVTCGVLKSILTFEKHEMVGVGGKGLASRDVPNQLRALEDFGLDGTRLSNVSRMVAKVDNAAIQDSYNLYQHVFFVDEDEHWTVIQQGMESKAGDARRYHWTSFETQSFIDEPHSGIISGVVRDSALDLTAEVSEECRKTTLDIVSEEPRRIRRYFENIKSYGQNTLIQWLDDFAPLKEIPSYKVIPNRMDWRAVRKAYENQPRNYEELLSIEGIGPATIRGLSLVADLIFGSEPSWADPVRMTFAFGGKDGVPFPVPRKEYDEAIAFMETALNEAKLGRRNRVIGLKRLRRFAPPILVHKNAVICQH